MNNSEQITTFLIVAVLILAAAPIPALTVFAGGTATVSLADFDTKPVSTIKVPLMIYNVTAVAGGELNISFDPSVVHLTDISDGDIGTTTANINNDAGWAYMNVFGTEGKSGDVVFANLNLTAVGSEGDKSPLNISVISLFDTTYMDIPYNTDNGTFAIRDITPLVIISNVAAADITSSSAKIIWDTDVAADSLVRYRTESETYNSVRDSIYVTSHSVDLTELTPSTTYYYVVNSTGQSGNSDQSSEYSFTTLEAPTMPKMHVGDITMSSKSIGRGRKYKAIATVPILDSSDKPVDGATAEGHWSGAYSSNTVSGTTSNDGKVTFDTKWVKGGGMFTFTVDNVLKEGWTYNESANIETSDSI